MRQFFRRIREGLLSQNSLGKYLLYATGEILLVVIGILLALQLDNWNDARKERNQLHAKLDQIYTVIDQDIDMLITLHNGYQKQIVLIDSISNHPQSVNPKLLPYWMFYIDLGYESLPTEMTNLLQDLKLDPEDINQRSLGKAFSAYEKNFSITTFSNRPYLTPLLEAQHISHPSLVFELSNQNNFQNVDLNFFSDDEITITQSLIDNKILKRALKSLRSAKQKDVNALAFFILFAEKKQAAVKEYYPNVVLLYQRIGLVGDATENNSWDQDIDLVPTDKNQSIWEKDLILKDGFVKFREGHDWIFNWGGKGFPKGDLQFSGDNIKVKAGRYHVVLNITEKKYRFLPL